ncbi:iron chelate uptake ABC transporter family permease subunit, partial [Nocardiopsis sp. MG754419]|uniref:FecCD family ABC transporter permease n=1 Tax=Nocardiopsis sp. MG754419 TaxID=2259865 RepID=UPI001BA69D93
MGVPALTHRGRAVVRVGGLSVLVSWPSLLLTAVLGALAATVSLVSLTLGDFPMGVGEVTAALTGQADPMARHVVVEMRLPRTVTGLAVGAALALSGALLQRLAHNPLVSPDVVGVSAGATAGAVAAIVVLGGAAAVIASGALIGAVTTSALLYLLAYRRGVGGQRLVLVGVAVTAMLGAATSYLLTRTDLNTAQRAMVWLTGSLANRDWPHVVTIVVALAVLAPLVLFLARSLSLLELGGDTAAALGGRVR